MKTASFLKHLVVVSVLGVAIAFAYNYLENGGSESLALRYASPYSPPSQEDALSQAEKNLEIQTQKYLRVKEGRKSDPCYMDFDPPNKADLLREMDCRRGARPLAPPVKPVLDITRVLQRHRSDYEESEIVPLKRTIEGQALMISQLIGGLLGFWMLILTFKWIVGTIIPSFWQGLRIAIAVFPGGIKRKLSAKNIGNSVKSLVEEHRLNKAKEQIQTLEKLLDSGLISEAEFARRKELLRESLRG